MSPRMVEHVDRAADRQAPARRAGQAPAKRAAPREPPPPANLLSQETVLMTVLAQDPLVTDRRGPARARIPVPAERLQRGPRGHRLHVVDVAIGSNRAFPP